jgi:hypothetical protein
VRAHKDESWIHDLIVVEYKFPFEVCPFKILAEDDQIINTLTRLCVAFVYAIEIILCNERGVCKS